MNYDKPREIQRDGMPTGLWHYTSHNDRTGTHAIGGCGSWMTCPACNCVPPVMHECEACQRTGVVINPNPCRGHATPEDACEHQKQYLLEHAEIKGPKANSWPKTKCAIDECENEATYLADLGDGWHHWELCEHHANKEALAMLVRVGESCHS